MARALRFQYPGAIYHVMARGDGGKTVFENKADCEVFLHRLGEACGSCGWRVHVEALRKEDERKALLAGLLASKTAVSRGWLDQRLGMGHPGSVNRMLGEVKRNKKTVETIQ